MTSLAWFLWYGLKIGLTYREASAMPFGYLLDLIAVEQIKNEGAKEKKPDNDDFFALLRRK